MKATRLIVGLAFMGLYVGCEPDPSAPEMETQAVEVTALFSSPFMGNMGLELGASLNNGATVNKNEIGCQVVDGLGNWFPAAADYSLPCNHEVATYSKNGNAMIVVRASGVPNPTGKMVRWGPDNPGEDWAASYPDLQTGPYPCYLLGPDYDMKNPLLTIKWSASVTPSGEAKLVCHYQKKWEFQSPD
jgi:hypothetical protein